jgi:hypothetical protein
MHVVRGEAEAVQPRPCQAGQSNCSIRVVKRERTRDEKFTSNTEALNRTCAYQILHHSERQ